jgi:NADH-quinone oxidoreductase subunit G
LSEQKKIKLTINDKTVEVSPGTTVFQASQLAGQMVPHYCYHPDLSIAGVCRMCMVEIEKNPRLQISCNTVATEGMVVRSDTPKVKEAVKGILELHLINHPLDCPICDKAGECKLQDYYGDHGLYESRMEYEKVHKPKVQDIGTIVLDSERCILCTRCVRFTAEVTKTYELGIFNRGDRSVLKTYDDGPLRNDYTGNLADICPVGALTAKDFRFKQRVWFLDKVDTVCGLCARGCNTTVSVNPSTTKLYRIEPRRNPEVNMSWMCDAGRWDYHYVHDETRIKTPRHKINGQWCDVPWQAFFQTASEELKAHGGKTLVALSTALTNEEISDAVTTLKSFGVTDFTWIVDENSVDQKEPYDGILKHRDLTPNSRGFQTMMEHLKVPWKKAKEAQAEIKKGSYSAVWLLGLDGKVMPGAAQLLISVPSGTQIVAHATNEVGLFDKCDWVLPNTSFFEKSGSYVNVLGRLQKLVAAVPWQFTSRDAHALIFGVTEGNDRKVSPTQRPQMVFKSVVGEAIFPGVRIDWRRIEPKGVNIGEVGIREGVVSAKK